MTKKQSQYQEANLALIKQALKEYDYERAKKNRGRLFQNTKKLLQTYGQLEDYIEDALDQIDNNLADKLIEVFNISVEEGDSDYVHIHSIRQSKLRTAIIIEHINRALKKTEEYYFNKGEPEKFRALELLHIQSKNINEVAIELECSENTARRWANDVIRDNLNIALYGADGATIDQWC